MAVTMDTDTPIPTSNTGSTSTSTTALPPPLICPKASPRVQCFVLSNPYSPCFPLATSVAAIVSASPATLMTSSSTYFIKSIITVLWLSPSRPATSRVVCYANTGVWPPSPDWTQLEEAESRSAVRRWVVQVQDWHGIIHIIPRAANQKAPPSASQLFKLGEPKLQGGLFVHCVRKLAPFWINCEYWLESFMSVEVILVWDWARD